MEGTPKQLTFTPEEKKKLLNAHFPDVKMEDERECLHCGSRINVANFRVVKNGTFLFISCPVEECDGTPLDWMPISD